MTTLHDIKISYTNRIAIIKTDFTKKYNRLLQYYIRVRSNIIRSRIQNRLKIAHRNWLNAYFTRQRSILITHRNRQLVMENTKYQRDILTSHNTQNRHKKALLIGCNYKGTKYELNGCINDIDNIKKRIENVYGFKNINVMTDDTIITPTKVNIMNGIIELLKNATAGDKLLLAFSGHGTYTDDLNGDEKDGKDEMLVPLDFNCIIDDELKSLLETYLKKDVSLFAIVDCCHSGTMLDLKYQYYDETKSNTIIDNATDAETKGKVILISGCTDEQVSVDAYINNKFQGAMTWAFLNVTDKTPNIAFKDLIVNMRNLLKKSEYTQKPMLSSGNVLNLNETLSSVI